MSYADRWDDFMERGAALEAAREKAKRDAEQEPDPAWEEDDEGFVRAPLVNEGTLRG